MDIAVTRVIFDRKKQATTKIQGLVQIEVYYRRTRRYYSTQVKVCKDQWSNKYMVVNKGDSIELNKQILNIEGRIRRFINECIDKETEFSFEGLDSFLETSEGKVEIIPFIEERLKKGYSQGTVKRYEVLIRALKVYGKIKYFEDISKVRIMQFDDYLRDGKRTQSTIHNYHKGLKAMINEAVRLGLVKSNPYDNIKIERGKSAKRKYLTDSEFEKVINLQSDNERIIHARDLFLFQCYTGLAYADMMAIDYQNDIEERDGRMILSDRRKKTETDYFIILLTPAIRILEKYDYNLPKLSNQKYNDALKAVSLLAGVKDLTSHMGRHTFAVWALNKGIPIEVVSKILGHTNIKTTQIYAKIVQSSVIDAFGKLEENIKNASE